MPEPVDDSLWSSQKQFVTQKLKMFATSTSFSSTSPSSSASASSSPTSTSPGSTGSLTVGQNCNSSISSNRQEFAGGGGSVSQHHSPIIPNALSSLRAKASLSVATAINNIQTNKCDLSNQATTTSTNKIVVTKSSSSSLSVAALRQSLMAKSINNANSTTVARLTNRPKQIKLPEPSISTSTMPTQPSNYMSNQGSSTISNCNKSEVNESSKRTTICTNGLESDCCDGFSCDNVKNDVTVSESNSNVANQASTSTSILQFDNKLVSASSLLNFTTDSSRSPAQMPFKIRSSKYRHVYGLPHKEEVCYKNLKITKNAAHDSAFCAVNPKFLAIVTEECGGGAFVVIPIRQTGRIDINLPKVTGHRGPVLDLKWNPFNDNEIASCSEDTTIKVWQISDHGLRENLNEWCVDLHGHQRKVGQIEWHPTAENIMISSSADLQVIIWNLEKAEPIRIISCHNDTIQSMCWNRDGSYFVTTCKDKKIRVIDPRTGKVINEGDGHQGSKISKVTVLSCGRRLFTTGFSRLSERQIAMWNMTDLSKPIAIDVVDCSSGILIPYYDQDTNIVFVAGKGDGNIRYYELTEHEPYMHYLSEYKSSSPQRGLGWMPKRGLDVTKNEIFRFYKLHATGGICEPISMIVPRKSEVFQEDIYPDTMSGIPSLSCDEWISGINKEPILMSLKDGAVPFMPKIVTYKQLGFSELRANLSRSLLNNNSGTSNTKRALSTVSSPYNSKQEPPTSLTSSSSSKIPAISSSNNAKTATDSDHHQSSEYANSGSNNTSKQHYSWSPSSQTCASASLSSDHESFNTIMPTTATTVIYDQKKLVLSSRSAFNKMSSSSSYSSGSPPSSPQCNSSSNSSTNTTTPLATESSISGYQRSNSTTSAAAAADNILKTLKIRPHMVHGLVEKNNSVDDNSVTNWDPNDPLAASVERDKNCGLNGLTTTSSSATTSTISNSSKESLNNELVTSPHSHNHLIKNSSDDSATVNQSSEEIEATYLSSVSKNLVTLRKTESLKLDSVQSIRNRFDRINTSTLNSLSRNPNRNNKSLKSSDVVSSSQNHWNSNSLAKSRGIDCGDESMSGSARSSSPPIILTISGNSSRHKHNSTRLHPTIEVEASSASNYSKSSFPLHINTLASANTTKITSNEYHHNHNHFVASPVTFSAQPANTLFLSSNGNSVIKKRVWTPVSTASGADSKPSLDSNSLSQHSSFTELQKSYFRLLEEKNSLKEQLNIQEKKYKRLEEELKIKDKRILNLENKLNVLMIDSGQITDTTDC